MSGVAVLATPAVVLTQHPAGPTAYKPEQNDVYLVQDVLDKQIIDTDDIARGARSMTWSWYGSMETSMSPTWTSAGWGCLRRLGLAGLVEKMASHFGRKMRRLLFPGQRELLPGDEAMRLKVPSDKMADLHPADLAEIISDLSRMESSKLLETLDVKTLADTLEEVEPDFQASLVEQMSDDKVADVLEEMSPDEAADLLAELPDDRSEQILNLMEDEEAEDVRKLLTYPEDQAGGIMNTEYVAVRPDITAEQVIALLRETAREQRQCFYVYV